MLVGFLVLYFMKIPDMYAGWWIYGTGYNFIHSMFLWRQHLDEYQRSVFLLCGLITNAALLYFTTGQEVGHENFHYYVFYLTSFYITLMLVTRSLMEKNQPLFRADSTQ